MFCLCPLILFGRKHDSYYNKHTDEAGTQRLTGAKATHSSHAYRNVQPCPCPSENETLQYKQNYSMVYG